MKKILIGLIVGLIVAGGVVFAQTTTEWIGHMVMRQRNPDIRFSGNLSFKNLAGTTTFMIPAAGSGGATKFVNYRASLSPTAMAATAQAMFTNSGAVQQFTVSGLTVTDVIFANGPTPTTMCPPTHFTVPAANTLNIWFAQLTTALCTPATGIYNIFAARS